MSDTKKCYYKREPKSKTEFKGIYPFCGCTCCGPTGKHLRKVIRSHRRNEKKRAIREGLLG